MHIVEIISIMKEPYIISKDEAIQITCEMIEILNEYGFIDSYKFILDNLTYDSYNGVKIESVNVKNWCKEHVWNCGLEINIEGEVWYLFNKYWNDAEYLRETYGEDATNDIDCMRKLRRIFRKHKITWERCDYGYLLSFRKLSEDEYFIGCRVS